MHKEEIGMDKTTQIGMDKTTLVIRISTIVGLLAVAAFAVFGYHKGIFASSEAFAAYILSLGVAAAIIFTIIQAIQVVIPILPGAIGCIAGIFAFGPVWGLIYSYIGICVGSIAAFMISKRYGMPVVRKFVSKKRLDKYMNWLEKGNRFDKFLIVMILFPVAPDDILCFLAGLTQMTFKKFSAIILLCKPTAIAVYSLTLAGVISFAGF
jgi:uncharacterized membrane protein YdjX (TVP38/TMEM64 family)